MATLSITIPDEQAARVTAAVDARHRQTVKDYVIAHLKHEVSLYEHDQAVAAAEASVPAPPDLT